MYRYILYAISNFIMQLQKLDASDDKIYNGKKSKCSVLLEKWSYFYSLPEIDSYNLTNQVNTQISNAFVVNVKMFGLKQCIYRNDKNKNVR